MIQSSRIFASAAPTLPPFRVALFDVLEVALPAEVLARGWYAGVQLSGIVEPIGGTTPR